MKDRQYIFDEILAERERQDIKHGDKNQTLTLQQFGNVLGEEVGEVVMAINDFAKKGYSTENLREELIQVAALAVAAVEKIDAQDVAFATPHAHIYFELLRAELSLKYSFGSSTTIKALDKNTLPAPEIIKGNAYVPDDVIKQAETANDAGCSFWVWEFRAYHPILKKDACFGFVYTDSYPHHNYWQAHGFEGIDTQKCYDLACKMVGLIS